MKTESEIKYKVEPKAELNIERMKFFKVFKPIVDMKKCTLCRACVIFCPHSAVTIEDKKVKIDYNKCDGCLICLRECEPGAIKEERVK